VGDSSDSSCVTPDASSTSSFFTLDPTIPSQCSPQTVSWNATRYQEPPDIRAFIPGGHNFGFTRPTSDNTIQQTWEVNIPEGTQMVLLVRPALSTKAFWRDRNARTSPLITITATITATSSQGDMCLNVNPPGSGAMSSSTADTSTPSITAPFDQENAISDGTISDKGFQ
jgi:hypothetical protein